jgi:hypothetical protein
MALMCTSIDGDIGRLDVEDDALAGADDLDNRRSRHHGK